MSQPTSGKPVTDMREAKKRLEGKRYKAQVLDAYDRLTHLANRTREEQRADVERQAREAL